jgi:hypothetical protein
VVQKLRFIFSLLQKSDFPLCDNRYIIGRKLKQQVATAERNIVNIREANNNQYHISDSYRNCIVCLALSAQVDGLNTTTATTCAG